MTMEINQLLIFVEWSAKHIPTISQGSVTSGSCLFYLSYLRCWHTIVNNVLSYNSYFWKAMGYALFLFLILVTRIFSTFVLVSLPEVLLILSLFFKEPTFSFIDFLCYL